MTCCPNRFVHAAKLTAAAIAFVVLAVGDIIVTQWAMRRRT